MGETRNLLIAIAIMAGLIVGIGAFMGDLFNTYETTDPVNLSSLQRSSEISEQVTNMTNRLNPEPVSGGILELFFEVGTGAYGSFLLILQLPGFIDNLLTDLANLTAVNGGDPLIPGWVIGTISLCVSIFILFKIISAIMRTDL